MAVKIRLARGGAKKKPYYRIVVANATAPRDGDFLEKVGTYNPLLPKGEGNRVTLKTDRINYWLSQGAIPSDRVATLISSNGIALPKAIATKIAIKIKARKPVEVAQVAAQEAAPVQVTAPSKVEEAAPVAEEIADAPQEVLSAPEEVTTATAEQAPIDLDLTTEEASQVDIDLTVDEKEEVLKEESDSKEESAS